MDEDIIIPEEENRACRKRYNVRGCEADLTD